MHLNVRQNKQFLNKMMSQHLNTMLEHLRMGPLKRTKNTTDSDNNGQKQPDQEKKQQQQQQRPSTTMDLLNSFRPSVVIKGNGTLLNNDDDEVDNSRISVVIDETTQRKKSLKDIPNGGIANMLENDKEFDPRKRYSIGNGDLRLNGKSRELSPSTRTIQQQRKLSADMRLRGSNNQLTDEYLMRRPVRLRSMCTNFEVYDSLHTKAIDVSIFKNQFFSYFHFPSLFNVFVFAFSCWQSLKCYCLATINTINSPFIDTINLNSKHRRKYCRFGRIGTNCLSLDLFLVEINLLKMFWFCKLEVLYRVYRGNNQRRDKSWRFDCGYKQVQSSSPSSLRWIRNYGRCKLAHAFNYYWIKNQSHFFQFNAEIWSCHSSIQWVGNSIPNHKEFQEFFLLTRTQNHAAHLLKLINK